jgi:hypothetical protein
MHSRFPVAVICVLLATLVAAAPAAGQRRGWAPPRTADGTPDLQGTFSFATITPLQRPEELTGKDVLTREEAAAFEDNENKRLNRDLSDGSRVAPIPGPGTGYQSGIVSFNDFWFERGDQLTDDRRTSLVVDPPDGRIPFNDTARARMAERSRRGGSGTDSYADRGIGDRCIMGFNSGPPMIPSAYNNNVQIFQTPGYVVILNEMIHNARIIPTDGRPHGTIPQWAGDSRGRWEGDTLVVDTIHFKRETSLTGSSANTHLVERFTRVDPITVRYEFTVTDQTSFTRPWTVILPLQEADGLLYEYACHEGNYALRGILEGARARERAEAAAK